MRELRLSSIIALCLALTAAMCAPADAVDLTISAASSLTDAFKEIGAAFTRHVSGVNVVFNFGSSGALATQIEQGAPVDVFASASDSDMNRLRDKGLIISGARRLFAGNSIALIVPSDSSLGIKSLADLRKDSVRHIAIGDPETTPGGRYAMQALTSLKLIASVRDRLVYGNDIRQVRAYVMRGEVEAGFVFSTDARAEGIRIACNVPDSAHEKIEYPAAVVKGARHPDSAKKFVSFLVSREAKRVLAKYGFKTPGSRPR